jgi:hypothetical protein
MLGPKGCTSPHTNISQTLCSFGICWPEGCTSPKSVKHCIHWNMLTRSLYLTKISQTWPSLRYVDPNAVHHQNKSTMVFIEICWPEGCTSSKSINHGSHSGILTRRLYITKISSALCSLEYVDPKVVPHQNQSNIVCIGICWPEGCTSPKSVKQCVYCDMLTRRLYLIKISSALCSFGICWPADCTSPKSVMRCAQSDMLTRRLYVFGEVSPK